MDTTLLDPHFSWCLWRGYLALAGMLRRRSKASFWPGSARSPRVQGLRPARKCLLTPGNIHPAAMVRARAYHADAAT